MALDNTGPGRKERHELREGSEEGRRREGRGGEGRSARGGWDGDIGRGDREEGRRAKEGRKSRGEGEEKGEGAKGEKQRQRVLLSPPESKLALDLEGRGELDSDVRAAAGAAHEQV